MSASVPMSSQSTNQASADIVEKLEKMRQHFDNAPYPRIPLERTPKQDRNYLYFHSLATPYYHRNQQVIETEGAVILDAGCGTGYKSFALAEANPGAKIVGIDISEESVKLARERLDYHNIPNTEFHTLTVEALPSLGMEFDYINCDEVLYLLPDPVAGLQAMKSVLKPKGIIRTNLHSSLQRSPYYQAQKLFTMLGLMDSAPNESEFQAVRDVMNNLQDGVKLKTFAWSDRFMDNDEALLANHLLRGDKGSTIPEFFSALRAADLDFISMVNWRQWDLLELFKDINELPIEITLDLADKSIEEQLHIFELLHSIHRLLDLWCGHPNQARSFTPTAEWTDAHWQAAKVHLHPLLKTPEFKTDLMACVDELRMFQVNQHLPLHDKDSGLDSVMACCLLPLLEAPQSIGAMTQHWKKTRPIHPATLLPTEDTEALARVKQLCIQLEERGFLFLESMP
jgi:2-polyprenyl-3-methyl-5-hydroxy-6-metoxy-1,4-benzoquinol methylase